METVRTNTISDVASAFFAIRLSGETSMTDILRAMKMIRGVESVKPITNWKNCVTPTLAKKIDKAHRDSEQGKTLSFATAADAQCWMDAL